MNKMRKIKLLFVDIKINFISQTLKLSKPMLNIIYSNTDWKNKKFKFKT